MINELRGHFFIHSFIFKNCFILVRVTLQPVLWFDSPTRWQTFLDLFFSTMQHCWTEHELNYLPKTTKNLLIQKYLKTFWYRLGLKEASKQIGRTQDTFNREKTTKHKRTILKQMYATGYSTIHVEREMDFISHQALCQCSFCILSTWYDLVNKSVVVGDHLGL